MRSRSWTLLLGLALLAACGGGGGGGPQHRQIAASAVDYWAAAAGSSWSYMQVDRRRPSGSETVLKTVTDRGPSPLGSLVAQEFDHSWSIFGYYPEIEYRYFESGAIRRIETIDVGFGLPVMAVDYAEVPAPLMDDATQTVVDQSFAVDVDGDDVADSVRIEMRNTLGLEATLSVAAGQFSDVLRSRQDLVVTVTQGSTGRQGVGQAVLTTWYAKGVGVVRRTYKDPADTQAGDSVTEELVGFAHGALRAGIVPALALDGIGHGSTSATPNGIASASGGGYTMTVASSEAGTVEGAIHDDSGVQVWRGTVLTPPAPYVFVDSAVTFDGVDFRVAAVRTILYNSPTEYAVVSQRLSAAGVARDGAGGVVLDTGIADNTQTLVWPRLASLQGELLVTWGRFDTSYVEVAPGLVRQVGYVVEGRRFDAQQQAIGASVSLGAGIPSTVVAYDNQYLLTAEPQVSGATEVTVWALDAAGVPVAGTPVVVASSSTFKGEARLQASGGRLWLSFLEWTPQSVRSNQRLMRLGHDGVLLDGTPAAPGRALDLGGVDSGLALALGSTRSALAWRSSYGGLSALQLDTASLTGTAPLPTQSTLIAAASPTGTGDARHVIGGDECGAALCLFWLEESAAYTSDRVMVTRIYPRYLP